MIILLPLEVAFGALYSMSEILVRSLGNESRKGGKPPALLSVLTKPTTHLIIQLDKSKIKAIALNQASNESDAAFTLIKRVCGHASVPDSNLTQPIYCTPISLGH